jgi:hypothetical protein
MTSNDASKTLNELLGKQSQAISANLVAVRDVSLPSFPGPSLT